MNLKGVTVSESEDLPLPKFAFPTSSVQLTDGRTLEIRIVQDVTLDLTGDRLRARTGEARIGIGIGIGGAVELTPAQATQLSERILKALDDAEAIPAPGDDR